MLGLALLITGILSLCLDEPKRAKMVFAHKIIAWVTIGMWIATFASLIFAAILS